MERADALAGLLPAREDRQHTPPAATCAIVRRQSGGGAILHDRELTYSLAAPARHPLTPRTASTNAIHNAFIALLFIRACRTRPLTIRNALRLRGDRIAVVRTSDEPFLCFQRTSHVADLAPRANRSDQAQNSLAPARSSPSSRHKILGSAQRRHRGAILQHGSLLIETSPAAPELPGFSDLNGREIHIQQLISSVCQQLTATAGLEFTAYRLSKELESKAHELATNKYGSEAWTNRR